MCVCVCYAKRLCYAVKRLVSAKYKICLLCCVFYLPFFFGNQHVKTSRRWVDVSFFRVGFCFLLFLGSSCLREIRYCVIWHNLPN